MFASQTSFLSLNLSDFNRKTMIDGFSTVEKVTETVFDESLKEIVQLMFLDGYSRFLATTG